MTGNLTAVLAGDGVRAWYQPVVDLGADPFSLTGSDPGHLVGYEALARGPAGPLHAPGPLFAAARAEGLLTRLDDACRQAAFTGTLRRHVGAPLALFVNVDPEALEATTGSVAWAGRWPSTTWGSTRSPRPCCRCWPPTS